MARARTLQNADSAGGKETLGHSDRLRQIDSLPLDLLRDAALRHGVPLQGFRVPVERSGRRRRTVSDSLPAVVHVSGNRALVPVQAARKFPVVAALHIHTVSDAQRRVDSAGVDAAMAFPTRQDHTEQQRRRRIHPYSNDGRDAERSKRSVLDLVDSVGTLLHTGLPGHARRTASGRKGKIGTNEIIRTEKDQPNKQ